MGSLGIPGKNREPKGPQGAQKRNVGASRDPDGFQQGRNREPKGSQGIPEGAHERGAWYAGCVKGAKGMGSLGV